jgi:hypothetical protein
MTCDEVRDRMPDVAAGVVQPGTDATKHIENCAACAEQLRTMRATMALLDEWRTPEPSPYFDMRLQARLREEISKPQAGWRYWFRRPVFAAALTVILGIGIGIFVRDHSRALRPVHQEAVLTQSAEPGSAVSDLQSLDTNHDMYSDFELLDDLEVQQNVTANP